MRLISLRLLNFRQHVDTRIDFRRGLTGIIGPNGAGKSTILESIAWAIYGAGAARGTNETIRFARAAGGSRVLVEVAFELGGHEYKVARGLTSASVTLDGGITPVATGIGGVTTYLQSRIGMTREEFFNTYFTGQKELQFLAQLGPAQRGRFLAQVLGYERLKRAQDLAKDRRRSLHSEMMGIREVLPDELQLKAEREAADARLKDTKAAAADAEKRRTEREQKLTALKPVWQEAQEKRDQVRQIEHENSTATRDGESAQREVARAQAELDKIAEADKSLAPLRNELLELEPVAKECEHLAALRATAERRRVLVANERDLTNEIEAKSKRLKELEAAPELLKQLQADQAPARAQLAEAEAALIAARDAWTSEKQDVATKLAEHLARHAELEDKVAQLREAGPEGTCPICTKPLGEEFENVLGLLEDQLAEVKQNGKWYRQRKTSLEKKPEDLATAEQNFAAAQKAAESLSEKLARCQQAVQEIWNIAQDRQEREAKLRTVRAELAQVPDEYDAKLHAQREARLKELQQIAQKAARFEQVLEAKPARQKDHAEAVARAREALQRLEAGAARLKEIAFDPKRFEQLRQDHDQAVTQLHAAEITLTESKARVEAARDQLAAVKQSEKIAAENRAKLEELEADHRHHIELENALQTLRHELNARVKPELSELASIFLNQITDGRYTALEIDDSYNVLVLDEGEEKPVISGGEEDVANLVLRIAISQMIAERAGQQLNVLFLDEVFGSLDLERRDNVIQLLHRLEDRFEQVVLITHIETIREGLDHVIRVTYDERTGASTVTEDNVYERELVLIDSP